MRPQNILLKTAISAGAGGIIYGTVVVFLNYFAPIVGVIAGFVSGIGLMILGARNESKNASIANIFYFGGAAILSLHFGYVFIYYFKPDIIHSMTVHPKDFITLPGFIAYTLGIPDFLSTIFGGLAAFALSNNNISLNLNSLKNIDRNERLFAGVVLIVISLAGLVYRFTGFEFTEGTESYYIASIVISTIFLITTLLGIFIVYDAIKLRSFDMEIKPQGIIEQEIINTLKSSEKLLMEYIAMLEEHNKELENRLIDFENNKNLYIETTNNR
jgi:hypothetical protein